MKLELKHLAPYLPYGLKVQYWGIINGKVLSQEMKQFEKDGNPFDFTEAEYGLKTATLKDIKVFKNYWKCYAGNNGRALKSFYNGCEFRPILHSLSDFDLSDAYKEINEFHTLGYDEGLFNDAFSDGFTAEWLPYNTTQIMLKYHFDIFGLIPAGLAININTINL